jgi:hypothetical protein
VKVIRPGRAEFRAKQLMSECAGLCECNYSDCNIVQYVYFPHVMLIITLYIRAKNLKFANDVTKRILQLMYIYPYVILIITLYIRVKILKFKNYVTKCNFVPYVYFSTCNINNYPVYTCKKFEIWKLLQIVILYHMYVFPCVILIITLYIRVTNLKFANYVTKCNFVPYVYFSIYNIYNYPVYTSLKLESY